MISTSSGCHHARNSTLKEKTPNIELPNDENKLFDVVDDVGTRTILDLSVPSEDEEEVTFNNAWEHAIDFCSSSPHFILIEKVSDNGLNIRIWMT